MILAENIEYLRNRFPQQLEIIKKIKEENSTFDVIVSNSKNGIPTIQIEEGVKRYYLHSKYNPLDEAERLVDEVEKTMSELTNSSTTTIEINGLGTTQSSSTNGESYNYILFYGTGMGYHIDAVIKRFPGVPFSIYEPNSEIFRAFISNRRIDDSFGDLLKNLYLEIAPTDIEMHLNHFINKVHDKVLLVTLPSYERIFKKNCETFLQKYREKIQSKRVDLHTNLAFEKRWTINSIKNFSEVLNTPNILHDINRENFKDKPVLLVSAGPSLSKEIENIRHIKENELAYIFSVGSAIKALLKNNIYPDCVLSYDPGENTQNTFNEINERNINSIPLIFGSTIGYETLEKYSGPKLHMITSQDAVSSAFLKLNNEEVVEKVSDAPSIAVVTLELLYKLGANPIILVGQNFAFKKDQYYADGISYGSKSEEILQERASKKLIMVDDVYGEKIYTEPAFLSMKEYMEMYIDKFSKHIKIINTTKGGAHIKGTLFENLNDLIINNLDKKVVNIDWNMEKNKTEYNLQYLLEKREELNMSFNELKEITKKIIKLLQGMNENKNKGNNDIVIRTFTNLDLTFKQFTENSFFQLVLLPMNEVRFNLMKKSILKSNEINDALERVKVVLNEVTMFVYCCKSDYEMVEPMFNEMYEKIVIIGNKKSSSMNLDIRE